MKRLKCLFILLAAYSFAAVANDNIYNSIKWISSEDAYVTTIANSIIYEIPETIVYYPALSEKDKNSITRQIIPYEDYTQKIIKKPKTFKVRGYANKIKNINFDTYAVEIKKKIYLLPAEYVADNSLINKVNKELNDIRNTYLTRINACILERDSIKAIYLPICEKEFQKYNQEELSLPATIDSTKTQMRLNESKLRTEWYNSLPKSAKNAYSKLSINMLMIHEPNSASGCNLTFYYTNNALNKTIKYLEFVCQFYNAVNDIVSCTARHRSSFDGIDTGPIYAGQSGGGIWERVIYNWSAKYAKINSILITYLDGSQTSIKANDIKYLLTSPSNKNSTVYNLIKQNNQKYEFLISQYEEQLRLSRIKSKIWAKRIKGLNNHTFHETGLDDVGAFKFMFGRLHQIECDYITLTEEFNKFKLCNFID